MPRQQGDPAFADDEQLYRRLHEDWIGIDGRVRTTAIDLQGTSVDRGLFVGEPSDCLTRGDPDEVAVAVIAFGDIPARFEVPPEKPGAPAAKPYDSVVVYKPLSNNVAHSEIRFCRPGETENSKPSSPALKSQIRGLLAERLRVVYRR
jgi:hypothetical protein